uniref:Innexin n=1 Tax=Meloidogyne enterolobii TaxID=390850 RepID=A0A6V7VAN9_MELEN|nr:unnamed protein product [Meloidogyne enterolobii]
MLGSEYLNHLWKGGSGKLKALARPLLKDGIGDRMDKGNLWVIPGFTMFVFAVLWTTKLSKIALEESTCRGASIYNFEGTQLDDDAKRHCETAKRYYVGVNEQFSLDPSWRTQREVKNPEWVLWFWGPIVFVMYVLTRFVWTLLMENQGINFPNVISASQSVTVETDGIIEVDEERLLERLSVVAENFRTAYSSRAFGAFLAFEFSLVLAPLILLLFVLPLMIGANYRSWGFDIMRAWWEGRDWQGNPLAPFFEFSGHRDRSMLVPLVPRITYCDYHFVSLGNTHTLTYRCYLDANWHERTALFTWVMLVFLTLINVGNLFFWVEWAIRMRNKRQRRKWVTRKWLNADGFSDAELTMMIKFAEEFRMGQLLYFYFIECHTDRVVASAFCTALFGRWLEKKRRQRASLGMNDSSYPMSPPPQNGDGMENRELGSPIGWKLNNTYPHVMPTAPFATPPSMSFSDAPTVAMGGRKSISSSGIPTPKSPAPITSTTLEMGSIPSTTAIVGSMKGRCPNMAAEVGRESAFGNSAFDRKKYSKGRLQRMNEAGLPEVDEEQPLTMKVPEGDENEEKEGDEEEEEGDESSNTSIQKGTSQQAKRKVTDTKATSKQRESTPQAKKRGGGVDERTPLRESSVGTTTSGGSSGGNQKKGGKKKGTPPKDTFQDEENEAW